MSALDFPRMEGGKLESDEHDEMTQVAVTSAATHTNPTQSLFLPFQMMESLSEKLKLLDYEQRYCYRNRIKGLSKLYFVVPTNPGEQFNTFVGLAAWLINEAGLAMEMPQEYDDPNATIATVLDSLRSLVGQAPEFPPSKLKSGCGEYCIHVLDLLADTAIKQKYISFEPPLLDEKIEAESITSVIEDTTASASEEGDLVEWTGNKVCVDGVTSELRSGIICDSEVDADSDDDENDLVAVNLECMSKSQAVPDTVQNDISLDEEPSFIDSHGPFGGLLTEAVARHPHSQQASELAVETMASVERGDWQMEVERVLPQLRLATYAEARDWRSRLDQIDHHSRSINVCFTESRGHLKTLQEDLSRGLDKISSREKYINSQIDRVLTEYRCVQDRLSEVKEAYTQASGNIAERSKALAQLSEEVERVKQEMEQRGSSMTDGSPVVHIKQAIQRLKAENVAMEIRTGVLEHTLLRLHLRAREESQKPLFTRPLGTLLANAPLESGGVDVI
ncbi:Intraflagellar transport protein 57 -like protein [Echinococcus granulosus]|nr:Intraflagellar transport protein 57 -like protein [Echinococcus granulosus]